MSCDRASHDVGVQSVQCRCDLPDPGLQDPGDVTGGWGVAQSVGVEGHQVLPPAHEGDVDAVRPGLVRQFRDHVCHQVPAAVGVALESDRSEPFEVDENGFVVESSDAGERWQWRHLVDGSRCRDREFGGRWEPPVVPVGHERVRGGLCGGELQPQPPRAEEGDCDVGCRAWIGGQDGPEAAQGEVEPGHVDLGGTLAEPLLGPDGGGIQGRCLPAGSAAAVASSAGSQQAGPQGGRGHCADADQCADVGLVLGRARWGCVRRRRPGGGLRWVDVVGEAGVTTVGGAARSLGGLR